MALNIEDKKAIVAEVNRVAGQSLSAVAATYRGLTVGEMDTLRAKARAGGVYLRVVRNTLARRALTGTEFECINDSMVGPLVLAFSREEPGAAPRLIRDFAKEHDKMEVKVLSIGGKMLGPEQLNAMANLPTKEQAIASLMRVMKAPVEKFVRTLAAPHTQLVRTLAAVRDAKQ